MSRGWMKKLIHAWCAIHHLDGIGDRKPIRSYRISVKISICCGNQSASRSRRRSGHCRTLSGRQRSVDAENLIVRGIGIVHGAFGRKSDVRGLSDRRSGRNTDNGGIMWPRDFRSADGAGSRCL